MERVVDPAIADLQHEPFSASGYLAVVIVVVSGGVSMLRSTMRCSFCRRPDSEVAKLVAGPWRIFAGRVYICDRCAMETIQIMEGQSSDESPRGATGSLFRRTLNRWGWSRRPARPSECRAAPLARAEG
jgi:hypothetical protein